MPGLIAARANNTGLEIRGALQTPRQAVFSAGLLINGVTGTVHDGQGDSVFVLGITYLRG